jgi:hypothetical protein
VACLQASVTAQVGAPHPPSPVAAASSRLCPRGGTQHLLLGGVANRAGGVSGGLDECGGGRRSPHERGWHQRHGCGRLLVRRGCFGARRADRELKGWLSAAAERVWVTPGEKTQPPLGFAAIPGGRQAAWVQASATAQRAANSWRCTPSTCVNSTAHQTQWRRRVACSSLRLRRSPACCPWSVRRVARQGSLHRPGKVERGTHAGGHAC